MSETPAKKDAASAEAVIAETLQLAIACQQAARYGDAEALYRSILEVQPRHAEANHHLGTSLLQAGQPEGALEYLGNACAVAPQTGRHWIGIAECLLHLQRHAEAMQVLETAIQAGLDDPQAEALLAQALAGLPAAAPEHSGAALPEGKLLAPQVPAHALKKVHSLVKRSVQQAAVRRKYRQDPTISPTLAAILEAGDWHGLEVAAWQALEQNPLYGKAWDLLGMAYLQLDRNDLALIALSRANVLLPKDAEAWDHLGVAQRQATQYAASEGSFRKSLALQPLRHETWINLGNLQLDQSRPDDAIASFRRALELKPDYVEVLSNLGMAYMDKEQPEEAIACYRRVLELRPDLAETHNNLALALRQQNDLAAAMHHLEIAVAHKPAFAGAHTNLGSVLQILGKADEAIAHHRQALAIKPELMDAQGTLIFALDLSGKADTHTLQEERRNWDRLHAAPLLRHKRHTNDPDPARRLRVGYVSADLRQHSAAFVFGAMLVHFNPAAFEVFAYSNSIDEETDGFTQLFRKHVGHWRNIVEQSDDAVADLIRQDRIDILVDLSGHSAGNRLLVFARKPAPVQITAWGYATSTGMRAMDVFFADPVLVPPEEKHLYTEEIRYLPNAVSAFYPTRFPDINDLPALAGNGITFGSFNRLAKTSEEVFALWARILAVVPASRLIFKAGELDDTATRKRVADFYIGKGIAPGRVLFQGKTDWSGHLQAYNQIDIALDTFPHCGGVTTLESLAMSVPVITLRRPTIAGRLSASILTTLNLREWIAETPEQYVAIAMDKARDIDALAALRRQLRSIFTSSIIGNPAAYARAVEREYRQLWGEWCAKQPNGKQYQTARIADPT